MEAFIAESRPTCTTREYLWEALELDKLEAEVVRLVESRFKSITIEEAMVELQRILSPCRRRARTYVNICICENNVTFRAFMPKEMYPICSIDFHPRIHMSLPPSARIYQQPFASNYAISRHPCVSATKCEQQQPSNPLVSLYLSHDSPGQMKIASNNATCDSPCAHDSP